LMLISQRPEGRQQFSRAPYASTVSPPSR